MIPRKCDDDLIHLDANKKLLNAVIGAWKIQAPKAQDFSHSTSRLFAAQNNCEIEDAERNSARNVSTLDQTSSPLSAGMRARLWTILRRTDVRPKSPRFNHH